MVDANWTDISWANAVHPKRGDHILISPRTALQPKWAARKVVKTSGWKVRVDRAFSGSEMIQVQQVRRICRSQEEAESAAQKINQAVTAYREESAVLHHLVKREIEGVVGRAVFRSSAENESEPTPRRQP